MSEEAMKVWRDDLLAELLADQYMRDNAMSAIADMTEPRASQVREAIRAKIVELQELVK